MFLHADPVTEYSPAGEGTGGIDGQYGYLTTL
jgi:hypothetical protein